METKEFVRRILELTAEGRLTLDHNTAADLIIGMVKADTELAGIRRDVDAQRTIEGHAL